MFRLNLLLSRLLRPIKFLHTLKSASAVQKLCLLTTSLMLIPKCIQLTEQQIKHQVPTESNVKQQQNKGNLQNKNEQQIFDVPEGEFGGVINFIKHTDDASKLNLKGNALLWYECCGVPDIDQEVIDMLRKFVMQNYNSISCPFKVIIDSTPHSRSHSRQQRKTPYLKQQLQLVLLKPDGLKPILLSKHLSFQRTKDLKYSQLFQRLVTELNEYIQINTTNITNITQGLGNSYYEGLVVMNAAHDALKIRTAKKKFTGFVDDKAVFGAGITKGIVTDELAVRQLGLPNYKEGEDNIYVILPDSENIKKSGHQVIINNQKCHIYRPEQVPSSVIFPPYLQKSNPDSLTLKIIVDLNQNIGSQLTDLYETLSNVDKYQRLSQIPKIMVFNSAKTKQKPIQVMLQKNNFDQIVNVYSQGCRYSDEEKRKLLYEGSRWSFEDEDISAELLEKWIGDVVSNKVEPSYDSEKKQDTKVKKFNSLRITGEQYPEIVQKSSAKPKVVFHYSEHCFSCNKFKHIYEQIADQKKQEFDFYRINNDFNRSKGLVNYNTTPVFVIYKDGKNYIYKNTIFTKALFESFLDISRGIKNIDQDLLDKVVQDRAAGDFKIDQL